MKTKIIALMLTLMLVVLMAASCGLLGGDTNTDNNTDNSTSNNNNNNNDSNDDGSNDGPKNDDDSNNNGGTTDTTITYPWSTTTLIYEMSENSNKKELPSTCKRFLAGETDDDDIIDDSVRERNDAAMAATKTTIVYDHKPDTDKYGWGENVERINGLVTGLAADRPDMFCNFVYDISAASLKGAFSNLLQEKDTSGENYFVFREWAPNYEDRSTGYMHEYMRYLTLSKTKMYCLSSDYFTDMIRAFFVVPVNVRLISTISATTVEGQYNTDRNGDGTYTIADFYELVEDGEWTYETLAAFSEAINVENESVLDGTIGFALATGSGLSASGMLYTTSIKIIDRTYNENTNEYTYFYTGVERQGDGTYAITDATPALYEYCDKLAALFSSKGVVAVGTTESNKDVVATPSGFTTPLQAIRAKFASGNILFGGVVCLGSLEYEEYVDMQSDDGDQYGVAPVPLYKAGSGTYQTQIHNLGRVGAISATTQKFSQCTAFLNYQSTHSSDILEQYYEYNLKASVLGDDVKGSIEMLDYIRDHVRSSFDKAFEDVMGNYFADGKDEMWHYVLNENAYQITSSEFAVYYEDYVRAKAENLYDLETSIFPILP